MGKVADVPRRRGTMTDVFREVYRRWGRMTKSKSNSPGWGTPVLQALGRTWGAAVGINPRAAGRFFREHLRGMTYNEMCLLARGAGFSGPDGMLAASVGIELARPTPPAPLAPVIDLETARARRGGR